MSQPEVQLRRAQWRDAQQVWSWNNAPEVRRWSMNPRPIALRDHERWYRARLDDPRYHIWIAQAGARDVGVVRVEESNAVGTVSIALDRTARGQGLGHRALDQACEAFFDRHPAGALDAWIANGNEASVRCFERCGFAPHGADVRQGRTFMQYRMRKDTSE